jgi:hypothetical protein
MLRNEYYQYRPGTNSENFISEEGFELFTAIKIPAFRRTMLPPSSLHSKRGECSVHRIITRRHNPEICDLNLISEFMNFKVKSVHSV